MKRLILDLNEKQIEVLFTLAEAGTQHCKLLKLNVKSDLRAVEEAIEKADVISNGKASEEKELQEKFQALIQKKQNIDEENDAIISTLSVISIAISNAQTLTVPDGAK